MLKVYKKSDAATLPEKATDGSACFDLSSALKLGDKVTTYNNWNKRVDVPVKMIAGKLGVQVHPDCRILVPTGLIFDIPEGYVLKLYVRSSVALKNGLLLANGTGIVDSDYVNETFVMLYNITDSLIVINDAVKLAQGKLERNVAYDITQIDEPPKQKTTRDGGFGSTDK
jgi:dUTP pyrophosphatase